MPRTTRFGMPNLGGETNPPLVENVEAFKKWDTKAGKALYVIKTTIEKKLLACIEDVRMPKEAWDALAALFPNKIASQLQLLERALMNVSHEVHSQLVNIF